MNRSPNILLIMSDEHDAAVTGCYGDPVVCTPNLDSLAENGVRFDACYCNSPLCSPSRLSFTAGQYISRCGAWDNQRQLPSDDYPSLPRALHDAKVTPYLCGKQHYNWDRRYGFVDLIPDLPSNRKKKKGYHHRRQPDDARIDHGYWAKRVADFHPGNESYVLDHDRQVNAAAVDFLQHYKSEQGPFFLFVGHLAPHYPLVVPQDLVDYYRGKVPMPNIPDGLLEQQPLNYQHLRRAFGTVDLPEEIIRYGRELYWALTHWYDQMVGQVLEALRDSQASRDTIVIYTSDHGENKGDHGLWWKNNMYDHGARVPLIVSDWRDQSRWRGGQRRTHVCSLVDLVQTILQLQDACPDPQMDGDSLLGILDDPKAAWKDSAISQYYAHNVMSGMTMYRKGPLKYIYHARLGQYGGERELYNMQHDPQELNNLAQLPEYQQTLTQMHQAMIDELGESPEQIDVRCQRDWQLAKQQEIHAHAGT